MEVGPSGMNLTYTSCLGLITSSSWQNEIFNITLNATQEMVGGKKKKLH